MALAVGAYAALSMFLHKIPWIMPRAGCVSDSATECKKCSSIFVVMAYMLLLFARNFLAHKHNAIVNKHRQNALLTFKALVDAAGGEERRDVILTYAAACIFSPTGNGIHQAKRQRCSRHADEHHSSASEGGTRWGIATGPLVTAYKSEVQMALSETAHKRRSLFLGFGGEARGPHCRLASGRPTARPTGDAGETLRLRAQRPSARRRRGSERFRRSARRRERRRGCRRPTPRRVGRPCGGQERYAPRAHRECAGDCRSCLRPSRRVPAAPTGNERARPSEPRRCACPPCDPECPAS